jgi:phenylpyruvate tautomerase PptA (4-oxalocrotonate tautomerase family)
MSLFTCVTTAKTLADDTKAVLAAEITKIHSSITGAPTSLVHVVFQELPATNVFTDSGPSQPLLIEGRIRAGRADADKTRLATEVSSSSSRIAGIPEARFPSRPSHDMNVRPRRAGPHNVCTRGFMRSRESGGRRIKRP